MLFASNVHVFHLVAVSVCTDVQIAVVAVMCKPHRCPHISMTGNICVLAIIHCHYCRSAYVFATC